MAPPDQHVGIRQHVVGQAVVGLVDRRGEYFDPRLLAEALCDRAMDAVGVDFAGWVSSLLLVAVLVPDSYTDSHEFAPFSTTTRLWEGLGAGRQPAPSPTQSLRI